MRRTVMASEDAQRMVALLRAVNVGGRVLRMADLTALVGALGYVTPKTLLQSGNIVFGPQGARAREDNARIETRIEAELRTRLALQADVFVRTAAEWTGLVAANPFTSEARADPARLVLMLLKSEPSASAVKALQASIKGRERVRASGRQLYMVFPDGQGTSKLTLAVVERALGTRGTARNWNTVLKLQALVSGAET